MDDDNDLCPLCCEELDMSDRQFFPCKCGYQVCMWCWHRIRESESGLCPACRTPYGDDPHEFSAVDVEEVLKANKEKAAAEKREKERLRQQQASGSGSGGNSLGMYWSGAGNLHGGADGDISTTASSSSLGRGPMEAPRDRNQLANMRVIRRNLVYAVGLPPSIATEEALRKPEYFGQYGKIAKIVLNRNHNGNGDPRRASSSAYVTFQHKEDTLSCILALDGFYLDGRNVRASYGTSKYCSAFIKNVRCNNPECTYLHCMGETEDTFTKQEIQAGYVTSGRDVLTRQQQIAAQAAAASLPGSRRKVGGGGPSGTGKASSSPVFPPPTYDEPPKTGTITGALALNRTTSASGNASSVALSSSQMSSKIGRSASVTVPASNTNTQLTSNGASTSQPSKNNIPPIPPASAIAQRSSSLGAKVQSNTTGTTIASVVAGSHLPSVPTQTADPAPHTTLTPLTPLKRTSTLTAPTKGTSTASAVKGVAPPEGTSETSDSVHLPPNMPVPKGFTAAERDALLEQRREAMAAMARQQREMAMKLSALRNGTSVAPLKQGPALSNAPIGTASTSPASSISSSSATDFAVGSIGGTIIGAQSHTSTIAGASLGSDTGTTAMLPGELGTVGGGLGGRVIGASQSVSLSTIGLHSRRVPHLFGTNSNSGVLGGNATGSGVLGGEIFSPSGKSSMPGLSVGPPPAKMNTGVIGGETLGVRNNTIWGNNMGGPVSGRGTVPKPIGGQPVGSSLSDGSQQVSGSSTLASMLGIDLPTGSGSLQESSRLWGSSDPILNTSANHIGNPSPGVIGPSSKKSFISAGRAEVGGKGKRVGKIGSGRSSSDIALLQSLLPGVHITSGNAEQPAAPFSGSPGILGRGTWNDPKVHPSSQNQKQAIGSNAIGGGRFSHRNNEHDVGGTWNGATPPHHLHANRFRATEGARTAQHEDSIW